MKGKYSPSLTRTMIDDNDYEYNALGRIPAPWNENMRRAGFEYDEETMLGMYDADGYDRYGYSAYDADGKYVGIGQGIDRWGFFEMDYWGMEDEDYLSLNGPAISHPRA